MISDDIKISKSNKKIYWTGEKSYTCKYTVLELHECLDGLFDDKISRLISDNEIELINGYRLDHSMLDRFSSGKIRDRNIKMEF